MPPKKAEKKRRNKRKSRTEDVSSASSSDSESNASEPEQSVKPVKKARQEAEETALNTDDDVAPVFAQKQPKQDSEKVFEEFYLRQATREFANDLDKLRSAGDFNAKSVPLLIAALKQGSGCFSVDERKMVAESVNG
ncbi:Putative ribosome-assembly protein [Septoria linicola]|uniref:Ribosome assembly protein 3 n=1 Tax=Septoria linicola TaxID=215465 RepID=A0A9Q9B817_9PEZI|nr:putative ribosome-assembly protein [Septoria linicola]USW59007.1 Putative ribosome-assembly protein [Septoria linicola]